MSLQVDLALSLRAQCILSAVVLAVAADACTDGGVATERIADSPRACEDGDPDRHRAGTDCLCCHDAFGVAGTLDAKGQQGIRIVVRDGDGQTAMMAPDPYGNFFRHLELRPPLEAIVVAPSGATAEMRSPVPHGSCNRCHRQASPAGPLRAPE